MANLAPESAMPAPDAAGELVAAIAQAETVSAGMYTCASASQPSTLPI